MSFKRGDKVTAFGLEGYVVEVNMNHHSPVTVQFTSGDLDSFLPDGRSMEWHKLPSLFKLVIEKKPKPEPTDEEIAEAMSEGMWGGWGGCGVV